MASGYLNPPRSEYSAVVDGRPTGLAGCTQAGQWQQCSQCLRNSPELTYQTNLGWPGANDCQLFILRIQRPEGFPA